MRIDALTNVEMVPVAVRTATVNGPAVDIRPYVGQIAFTQMSEAASAGDTLDGEIQDSPDGSTGWATVTGATFTQVTNAADATETIHVEARVMRAFCRYVGTVAGGTPSFAFGCAMHGAQQYR